MGAFARQNRPATSFSRPIVGAAIGLLSIAIVIIASPARSLGQVTLEHLINHREGINYQRVFCSPDSQPDKMKKITPDDVACRLFATVIGQNNFSFIRI